VIAHYKIISVSLYQHDLALVDALVAEMKRRGHSRANRSMLIRYALEQLSADGLDEIMAADEAAIREARA
jgi:Arc/MetJ-type ribon-helix-helix transcriptional regulator